MQAGWGRGKSRATTNMAEFPQRPNSQIEKHGVGRKDEIRLIITIAIQLFDVHPWPKKTWPSHADRH